MARPKKYEEGPARFTLTLSPADKAVLERFSLWLSYSTGKRLGIADCLLLTFRTSREFQAFEKTGGAMGPMFETRAEPVQLAPAPVPVPAAQEDATKALRDRLYKERYLGEEGESSEAVIVRVPPLVPSSPVPTPRPAAPPPPALGEDPDPDTLRAQLKACGLSNKEIEVKSGVHNSIVSRFLTGKVVPRRAALVKLQAVLKG